MILINDAQVTKIPIISMNEKFCDLKRLDERIKVDMSMSQIASNSKFFSFARVSVAEKLKDSIRYLPDGINFYIKEAYRPLSRQKESFENVMNHYRQIYTGISEEELYSETCKYVAPPEYAPHPTGAAIDITLISDENIELDLGTDFNATPQETENATFFNSKKISKEAETNRKILKDALTKSGFINYEPEWWHWSAGDRYWAYFSHMDFGYFDVVDESWIRNNSLTI